MSPTTSTNRRRTASTPTTAAARATAAAPATATTRGDAGPSPAYKVPVIGAAVPSGLVEKGFWAALIGSAVLGAVDPPLAALVGAGVLVARHRRP